MYQQYSPSLQGLLDGRVRDISLIADRPGVPTLGDVAMAYGNESVAVDWIKVHLEVVNGFANVQQRLNTEQLMAIGEQIYGLYPDLNLLEFALFCGRLRRGRYERWYGAVDGQKILVSLDAFVADRRMDIARRHEEEHRRQREEERNAEPVSPQQLFKENPGKYPTLEAIFKNGGQPAGIAKRVQPVRRRNNMSKILAIISELEEIGQRSVEFGRYGLKPIAVRYGDQPLEIVGIGAFLDQHMKVVGRMPEASARTVPVIEGIGPEYQDIRIDDLDDAALAEILKSLTTIKSTKKK